MSRYSLNRYRMLGRWFFARHGIFTWRPRIDRNELCHWNVWWLWFEVAYCTEWGAS